MRARKSVGSDMDSNESGPDFFFWMGTLCGRMAVHKGNLAGMRIAFGLSAEFPDAGRMISEIDAIYNYLLTSASDLVREQSTSIAREHESKLERILALTTDEAYKTARTYLWKFHPQNERPMVAACMLYLALHEQLSVLNYHLGIATKTFGEQATIPKTIASLCLRYGDAMSAIKAAFPEMDTDTLTA